MNLRDSVKSKIIKHVFDSSEWSVLVLNRTTARIITKIFKKTEILSNSILSLQRVEQERDQINFPAIYFVELDKKTIKNIKKDIKQKIYEKYLIIFINNTDQEYYEKLFQYENEKVFVKHFNLNFICLNELVFTPLYTEENITKEMRNKERIESIKSICSLFHFDLNLINLSHKSEYGDIGELKKKGTEPGDLIFLDRSADFDTALLHSFEFEAFIRDIGLLVDEAPETKKPEKSENEDQSETKQSIQRKNTKEDEIDSLLNSDLWQKVSHLHIAEVNGYLSEKAHEIVAEFTKIDSQKKLEDLKALVLSAPENIKSKKALDSAITLCEISLKEFERNKIDTIAQLEQNISTRYTSKGKKYHRGVKDFFELVESIQNVKRTDLFRIILLLLANGEFFTESETKILKNKLLLSQSELKSMTYVYKAVKDAESKHFDSHFTYEISRHKPMILNILNSFIGKKHNKYNKLFKRENSKEPSSLRKSTFTKQIQPQRKTILIVIDVLSYTELVQIRHFKRNYNLNVIVCCDGIVTPRGFIDWLIEISENEV